MVEAIALVENIGEHARTDDAKKPRLNPFRFPGYYFQLRLPDGPIIEKSRNLDDYELPLSEQARRVRETDEPLLETLDERSATALPATLAKLRLLTVYEGNQKGNPFYLQVGVSLERMRASIQQLRRQFLIAIPAALTVAAVASWLLARRSLAPIGEIVRQTREYSAAQLDRRIRERPGRDEVAELVSTINKMLERLEAAFRAQELFIANASHELQTPVSVLLGEAQVLRQQIRSVEEHERFVTSVQDEMRRMAQIVGSLLMLARADAGLPITSQAIVPVNELVTEVVRQCQALAKQREVRLVTKLALPDPDEAEPVVQGDHELLSTMLSNLVRNAIRHSPVDEPVEIEILLDAADVEVAVRDNGSGIPHEHLPYIFDRFYNVPDADQAFRGTGLGLAIVKGVAELHGGQIQVENRRPRGCEFVVRLPRHRP
jgi:heavy metal sensor kinase